MDIKLRVDVSALEDSQKLFFPVSSPFGQLPKYGTADDSLVYTPSPTQLLDVSRPSSQPSSAASARKHHFMSRNASLTRERERRSWKIAEEEARRLWGGDSDSDSEDDVRLLPAIARQSMPLLTAFGSFLDFHPEFQDLQPDKSPASVKLPSVRPGVSGRYRKGPMIISGGWASQFFDVNGDGVIDAEEFAKICSLGKDPVPHDQVDEQSALLVSRPQSLKDVQSGLLAGTSSFIGPPPLKLEVETGASRAATPGSAAKRKKGKKSSRQRINQPCTVKKLAGCTIVQPLSLSITGLIGRRR